jgi:hypothetical protein
MQEPSPVYVAINRFAIVGLCNAHVLRAPSFVLYGTSPFAPGFYTHCTYSPTCNGPSSSALTDRTLVSPDKPISGDNDPIYYFMAHSLVRILCSPPLPSLLSSRNVRCRGKTEPERPEH